jgi:hypothetical protein
MERVRLHRYDDTGRVKPGTIAGFSTIRFWIVLDCGEKDARWKPQNDPYVRPTLRKDRYVPVGVGVDQDIIDVEMEEKGSALPGTFKSFDEACEISSDLNAVCNIHES